MYVARRLDLREGEQRSPSHLRLNPAGKVPTLVDRSSPKTLIVSQSNAILMHVEALRPGSLLPTSGHARTKALERYFRILTDVIAPSHSAFRLRQAGHTEAAKVLDGSALEVLTGCESWLSADPFLAGESPTLADIAAMTIASAFEQRLAWSELPHLAGWLHRMKDRPAVRRGLAAFA